MIFYGLMIISGIQILIFGFVATQISLLKREIFISSKRKQVIKEKVEVISDFMDNPRVAIIILNWNGWKDTIECLESVYQINYPNYQVIIS